MRFTRYFFSCFGVAMFFMIGCVGADEAGMSSLARRQSATIEGLNNEIQRLNQELDGLAGHRQNLRVAAPKFETMFSGAISRGDMRVEMDSRGLVIAVLDHALFDPDETQLTPAGEEILGKIASVLSRELVGHRILLEGHTDNQPIEDAEGVTNWEYSIGRAAAVLHYFIENEKLPPQRFGVAGYAEFRPVDSNATEEGRDRNRRVEIVIMAEKVSDAPVR